MYYIKKLLYKLLSEKNYLKILHLGFYLLYDLGFLKKDKRFKYHYMIQHVIKKDFTVVDIGANLGYFSKNFARLTNNNGVVISIEPVPVFYDTLRFFMKKYTHCKQYNVALGSENGKITMIMPTSNGMIRTGLPHIANSDELNSKEKKQEVELRKGSELFQNLSKIDYIKCDIEGFELTVFQEIKGVIMHHQPYIQLEIGEQNLTEMLSYFESLGYTQYGISNFKFIKEKGKQLEEGDYFFVPKRFQVEFEQQIMN